MTMLFWLELSAVLFIINLAGWYLMPRIIDDTTLTCLAFIALIGAALDKLLPHAPSQYFYTVLVIALVLTMISLILIGKWMLATPRKQAGPQRGLWYYTVAIMTPLSLITTLMAVSVYRYF